MKQSRLPIGTKICFSFGLDSIDTGEILYDFYPFEEDEVYREGIEFYMIGLDKPLAGEYKCILGHDQFTTL